ncbi:hypothetical protein [Spiroplasma ixodetis]|uniref:hypothetical protein n=1 Tax=Spiroplasma ixodetis TaxID=2141 RepID=UPI002574D3C5|nr:hypothetical protein [Spiroplasma ixodetis]WJG69462.1 hypothetical protein SIXOD_v1c03290 [Spiroplasma ixodetis Y32]
MINKLWTGVSLENYNNWYPLTGKITETPQQYIQTWPNVNDWFKTFAIRAQNDINAYLGFILSKFPFDSFKDELIKETLRDMVYVTAEHWVFNRTPIEFNVDATIQFNNGSQFSTNSIPTINVWDLAPSRMKIWARLTELKQILSNYNDDEIDVEKIDLKAFYTRNQVDELIEQQKEFTLSKQIKLYDDLVDDNENEIYRGPVSKFINKDYVATDYDKETETMILDWPDEIGTLPPEALQNNPQIGDYTHAPTCDFSAKQQKQITTNENNITKLNDELTKTNENIDDIKNNWFNIVTSPLWKKMSSFIPSNEFGKIYLAIWGYIYQPPSTPTDNYIYSNKKTIFNLGGEIQRTTQKTIKLDELIVNDNVKIQLLFTKESNDITVVSNDINYQSSSIVLYQYIGKGRPTEFIAEEGTERDYYTKLETNNLLDKKQNKLTAGTNITIDENNKISATGGKVDLSDYYKKEEIDKKLKDKMDKDHFKYAFSINTIGTEIPNLETTDKTIAGAINELKEKIKDKKFSNDYFKYNTEANEIVLHDEENSLLCRDLLENNEYKLLKTQNKKLLQAINEILEKQPQPSPSGSNWKEVGTREKNKWDYWQITYDFQENKHYRVYYSWSIYNPVYTIQEFIITDKTIAGVPIQTFNDSANIVILSVQHAKWITIYTVKGNLKGNVWKLEELQE